MVIFTVEELTFLQYYKAPTVTNTVQKIQRVLPTVEDPEMLQLANCTINKLLQMSTEEFNSITFDNVLDISSEQIIIE